MSHFFVSGRFRPLMGFFLASLFLCCGLNLPAQESPETRADPKAALEGTATPEGEGGRSAGEDPLKVLLGTPTGDGGETGTVGTVSPDPDGQTGDPVTVESALLEPESPAPVMTSEQRLEWVERQAEQAQILEQDLRERLQEIDSCLKKEEALLCQFGPDGAPETRELLQWFRWSSRFLNRRRLDLWTLAWAANAPVPLMTLVAAGWGDEVRFYHPGFRVAAWALERLVLESDIRKMARIKEKIQGEMVRLQKPGKPEPASPTGGKP